MNICFYCGERTETRPYGPGGTDVCLPCVEADPEREKAAKANFHALIEMAQAASPHGAAVIGTGLPPEPYVGFPDD